MSAAILEHSAGDERLGLAAAGWPETVQAAFAPVSGVAEAQAYTRGLTHSHYENFSVVSVLLPKHLRQDFCNVYAFCRIADDLGDEVGDKVRALAYLADFRRQTEACFAGMKETAGETALPGRTGLRTAQTRGTLGTRGTPAGTTGTAVFVALAETIRRHEIPAGPFLDLISAFEQDQRVGRYETFEEVVDYCRRSADPVGRLVLYMCGYRDEARQVLSDKTCTALQLANFWQDVRRDVLERDRVYLPGESMRKFGVTVEELRDGKVTEGYKKMIAFEVERTAGLFEEGKKLLPLLEGKYRRQIALFGKGGEAILQAIRKQGFDTLTRRPALSKLQKARLVGGTLVSSFVGMFGGGR